MNKYVISQSKKKLFLPPANEVWGKVIFSEVCVILSTAWGWGSAWPGTSPGTRYTTQPPQSRHTPLGPGTHTPLPLEPHPPGPGTPHQDQVHPLEQTPQSRPPVDQIPPPPEQSVLGDTVNVRAVRILLECILVLVLIVNLIENTDNCVSHGRQLKIVRMC